jgi:hypothetical protein
VKDWNWLEPYLDLVQWQGSVSAVMNLLIHFATVDENELLATISLQVHKNKALPHGLLVVTNSDRNERIQ